MAVFNIEYFSEVLDMEWNVNVVYPDAHRVAAPDLPIVLSEKVLWYERKRFNCFKIGCLLWGTTLILLLPNINKGW